MQAVRNAHRINHLPYNPKRKENFPEIRDLSPNHDQLRKGRATDLSKSHESPTSTHHHPPRQNDEFPSPRKHGVHHAAFFVGKSSHGSCFYKAGNLSPPLSVAANIYPPGKTAYGIVGGVLFYGWWVGIYE